MRAPTGELRDQFIAVLGHDLRNPIASIAAGTQLLEKTPLDDKAQSIIGMMQESVARMSVLIDNVMDFARGRLGGGIALKRTTEPLEPALRHVIEELRSTHPGRVIEVQFDIRRPVRADRGRIGRLLSNLLGNALTYGAPDAPVRVIASTNGAFELAVINAVRSFPKPPGRVCSCLSRAAACGPISRASASGFTSRRKSPAPTAALSM